MTVQPAEYAQALNLPLFWQMHAEMDVFVEPVIGCDYDHRGDDDTPPPNEGGEDERRRGDGNEKKSIPPRHRNRFLIPLILVSREVIGSVGFEKAVMHDRVCFERVGELSEWSMHDIAMQ